MDTDHALLEAILDTAVDAMIVADADGTILRANPAAGHMFQHDPETLPGQSVSLLMPKSYAHQHDDFMRRHQETGENRIIGLGRELEGRRKDGEIFPLHLSVGETEVNGRPLYVAILHDLQDRHAAQEALSRSQRLDAIGKMTGGISHDFNNLLTVIIGNLELLDARLTDPKSSELLRDALESAELGSDLTSRLMTFARQSNLKPIEADLASLCNDTMTLLRRTMGAPYRVKTDCKPGLDKVLIDPVQLQSALINLAMNAKDAMVAGGELLITVKNVTIDDTYMAQETDIEPGHYVRISVSDNGQGMSLEAQQRAFEPFFTTKTDTGGTGLGLATVYGFVRQSGGHITLYSEPGYGTSFGLYFPALPDAGTAHGDHVQTTPDGTLPYGHGETVLVVEDNAKVRMLSIKRLLDLGYRALEAKNGDEAYRMLKSGVRPEIVFTDLVMPGDLNGYELAAKVTEEFQNIKLLLTSGYASDVVTGKMKHAQTYDILHKPYRVSDLAERLQALLAED